MPSFSRADLAEEYLQDLADDGVASAALLKKALQAFRELISCFDKNDTRSLWHKAETYTSFALGILTRNVEALNLLNASDLLQNEQEFSSVVSELLTECAYSISHALRKADKMAVEDIDSDRQYAALSDGAKAIRLYEHAINCAIRTRKDSE